MKQIRKMKEEKAITLIALVITIVVMLILAGVTINLTLGENGIFTTAQKAAKNYTDAQNKEQENLSYFTNTVDNIAKGNTTLTSQITGKDYGKYINYSVTVKNSNGEDVVLDKWRVFYNDTIENHVYIIYDGHLENTLIPNIEGIKKEGKYKAYWDSADISTSEEAVEVLKDITNWSVFATGISGATATGSPTYEMLANSWNSNPMVNSTTLTVGSTINGITDSTRLYMLPMVTEEVCYGYWLSTALENNPYRVWYITFDGYIDNQGFGYNNFSIRPLVCLPTETTGMVEKNVTIFN